MIFKCNNCGGNVVYHPEKGKMCCPHCDGIDSQQKVTEAGSMERCLNCGAPLTVDTYTSATKCEHCGCYIVFDERVEGEYRPHLMVPFAISKERANQIMQERFKKRTFAPTGFLSEMMLENMTGVYVPFFLYDINVRCNLHAEGVKTRVWTSGDTEYTERSYYDVTREMYVDFDRIPVDASKAMDDRIMDLMEPYDYKQLQEFKEDYMSGFMSEIFNDNADALRPRAKKKAVDDAETMLRQSTNGYSSLRVIHKDTGTQDRATNYTLMPVWRNTYSYRGKTYEYYINGQTGKMVGKMPVSVQKVFAYGATVWGLLTIVFALLKTIGGM